MSNVEDQDESEYENTSEVVNVSSMVMKFEIAGQKIRMKPGEIRSFPKAYATARQLQPKPRDPVPSIIELETGGNVVPATNPRAVPFIQRRDAALAREEATE